LPARRHRIRQLDHVAYAVADTDAMLAFYRRLGFGIVLHDGAFLPVDDEQAWRQGGAVLWAVQFGESKIFMVAAARWPAEEWHLGALRAPRAAPGTMEVCWVWDGSLAEAQQFLADLGVPVLAGPIERAGGAGLGRRIGTSLYFRDPDANLLELIVYEDTWTSG
jgi:catechol 2,3-dioxygenase-like lactoylglutathione lyase family enzyme